MVVGGNVEEGRGHMHTNRHGISKAFITDTHLSASYQSSLIKSVIRAALASPSQRDRGSRGRGGQRGRKQWRGRIWLV